MTQAASFDDHEPAPAQPSGSRGPGHGGDLWLLASVVLLVGLSWIVGTAGFFRAGDDLGYWLGVAGGVLMLVLLLYPLRKYLRALRNAGPVKAWFWMHLVCGIVGPWLILVHSTWHIGSLNAGVALYSMVIVVASGVVGRYLFVRVQHRLDGGQGQLQKRREQMGLAGSEARSLLSFAPGLEERLRAYEQRELPNAGALEQPLLRLLGVPVRGWLERRRCVALLDRTLTERAQRDGWPAEMLAKRQRRSRQLMKRYFGAVLEVAHYSLFDRLFAFWHVAHLPFVVLLAVSAVVHVVAVHAY